MLEEEDGDGGRTGGGEGEGEENRDGRTPRPDLLGSEIGRSGPRALAGSPCQKQQQSEVPSCSNAEASVLEEVGTCVCGCMVKMGKGTEPRPEDMGGQRQVPKQDADIQDMEPTVRGRSRG